MYQSMAALVDAISDFLIRERLEPFAPRDLFPKCAKIVNGSTNPLERPASLWDDAGYRLIVPGNDDLLTVRDTV
jgi:hypothetical protein